MSHVYIWAQQNLTQWIFRYLLLKALWKQPCIRFRAPHQRAANLLYSFALVSSSAAFTRSAFRTIFLDGFLGTASIKCTPPSSRLWRETRSASQRLMLSPTPGVARCGD